MAAESVIPDLFDYLLWVREFPDDAPVDSAVAQMREKLAANPINSFAYAQTGFVLRFANGDQASLGAVPPADASPAHIQVTNRPPAQQSPARRHFQPVTGPDAPPPK